MMRPSHLPSETTVNDNVPEALRYASLARSRNCLDRLDRHVDRRGLHDAPPILHRPAAATRKASFDKEALRADGIDPDK